MPRFPLFLLLILLPLAGCRAHLLPTPPPGHQPQVAGEPFSHAAYNHVLAMVVDPDTGEVDYRHLAANYLGELDGYLFDVAEARPDRWPLSDQKAFWINAHNAAAMRLIAADPDARDTKDAKVLGTPIIIAGERMTLATLQQRKIKQYNDPRMYHAINWGARGCPPLAYRAYDAVGLELQLDRRQAAWLENNPPFDPFALPNTFVWSINAAR